MSSVTIPRPRADEHSAYFGKYIAQVPEGDVLALLRDQVTETTGLLERLTPQQADFAYAPGKWTIKQVVGHMSDTERVMAYRALRFARGDRTELHGFDENAFVEGANFPSRTLSDLLAEFQVVRAATVHFAGSLDEEALARRGVANGNAMSVRALFYIIAGHERHHLALLRERYLSR